MRFAICCVLLCAGLISAKQFSLADAGLAVLKNVMQPYELEHSVVEDFPQFFIFDFFKGVWAGINRTFQSDLHLFEHCIACPPKIWKVWVKFYDYVKNITWENFNFMKLVDHIIILFGDTIGNAIPCIVLGMMIDKFVELILEPTWENLKMTFLKTLASNFQLIVKDAMQMVMSIIKGNFFLAGEDLGQILYVLIVH